MGMILDQMHDGVNAPMHRTAICTLRIAEIHASRTFPIPRHMHSVCHQFLNSLILCRGNRHHRNTKGLLQKIYIDSSAILVNLIHHVESKHHRNIQLNELQGQVQISLDICSIHDIDDSPRSVLQEKLTGHDFLTGIR